jgi:hypothetical protein
MLISSSASRKRSESLQPSPFSRASIHAAQLKLVSIGFIALVESNSTSACSGSMYAHPRARVAEKNCGLDSRDMVRLELMIHNSVRILSRVAEGRAL